MRYWVTLRLDRVEDDRAYYGADEVRMSMPVKFAKEGMNRVPDALDMEIEAHWDEDEDA